MNCIRRLPITQLAELPINLSNIPDNSFPTFNGRFIIFANKDYCLLLNCYSLKIKCHYVSLSAHSSDNIPIISTRSPEKQTDELEFNRIYYLSMGNFKILIKITHNGIYYTKDNTKLMRFLVHKTDNDTIAFEFDYFPAVKIKSH